MTIPMKAVGLEIQSLRTTNELLHQFQEVSY